MDHIAARLNIDPIELRLKNFLKEGDKLVTGKVFEQQNPLPTMIEKIKKSSNYDERKKNVEEFNNVSMVIFSQVYYLRGNWRMFA